jgi:hypothetical protein
MFSDFVLNGTGHGDVGEQFMQCRYEPNLIRTFVGKNGRKYVTVNTNKLDEKGNPIYQNRLVRDVDSVPSWAANATSLRKDDWIRLDRQVLKAARQRLRAYSDLDGANSFGGFDGMSKMMLEHETMSDPGDAAVDMDGVTPGNADSPKFQLEGLPLPITHADFWFSKRRLAISRNSGTPLDSVMAEAAGRRVAEMIEKTTIGTVTGVQYGPTANYGQTPQVYGYTNHPLRTTKTDLTTPTGSNPNSTVADVLAMRQLAYDNYMYGPYMLYHSSDWDAYMDNDYYITSGTTPSQTLRNRLRAIDGIQDVRRLDFLTDTFTLILVQMTSDVARAVNGMEIMTVQWEGKGGLILYFKVMAIKVPQIRADYNGNSGIIHATTS